MRREVARLVLDIKGEIMRVKYKTGTFAGWVCLPRGAGVCPSIDGSPDAKLFTAYFFYQRSSKRIRSANKQDLPRPEAAIRFVPGRQVWKAHDALGTRADPISTPPGLVLQVGKSLQLMDDIWRYRAYIDEQ